MLRRLFDGGWLKTGVKTLGLAVGYSLTLAAMSFAGFVVLVLFL